MFNEALGRNTQLLNKKQAEGFTPRAAMQDPRQILPDFEKKNTELWLFYNETLNWRKRNSNWRKIAEICSGKSKKWWPKTPIYKNCTTKSSAQILKCRRSNDRSDLRKTSSLYLKNCWWWQAIHENEQQRNKDMHEESKELQDKNDEKH